MLKFLTHKLKSQSLNEPLAASDQSDDDRDSGTESDDENTEFETASRTIADMEGDEVKEEEPVRNFRPRTRSSAPLDQWKAQKKLSERPKPRQRNKCPSPSAGQVDSALPSDSDHNYDHHSSEEELEVINNGSNENEPPRPSRHNHHQQQQQHHQKDTLASMASATALAKRCVAYVVDRDRCGAEKRKWSQANRLSFGDSSASSDDELRDLMGTAPVEFCALPPADAHKPGGGRRAGGTSSVASRYLHHNHHHQQQQHLQHAEAYHNSQQSTPPPPKLFHFSSSNFTPFEVCTTVSPRKRHRHGGGGAGSTAQGGPNTRANMQRPCLDFEKMRQLRDRAVSGWRQSREVSLIC